MENGLGGAGVRDSLLGEEEVRFVLIVHGLGSGGVIRVSLVLEQEDEPIDRSAQGKQESCDEPPESGEHVSSGALARRVV